MSDLENATKPILEPLMRGQRYLLTPEHKMKLAQWTVKTAFTYEHGLFEGYGRNRVKGKTPFFNRGSGLRSFTIWQYHRTQAYMSLITLAHR